MFDRDPGVGCAVLVGLAVGKRLTLGRVVPKLHSGRLGAGSTEVMF